MCIFRDIFKQKRLHDARFVSQGFIALRALFVRVAKVAVLVRSNRIFP